MSNASNESLDLMFRNARTHNFWQDKPVEDALLKELHDLFIMGPTSANILPARIVYVKSDAAKERLKPCMSEGNIEKTMSAPVTAIIGMEIHFYNVLEKTFPHTNAKAWFDKLSEDKLEAMALRNSSLQGGYFMLAARALGLDCGPMSGFNAGKVNAEFFADTTIKTNFICNLGYGDASKLLERSPRLGFDEISQIL